MVDINSNPGNYKTLEISTGASEKGPEIITFVMNHLKTNKMGENAVKMLPFVIKYVPHHYNPKKLIIILLH